LPMSVLNLLTGTVEKWNAFRASYPELTGGYSLVTKRAEDLETVDKAPNITKGLVARGYSDDEIEKILGGNFLRVFRNVWER